MNHLGSGRNTGITCPACGQEGQRITCSSGSRSEVVVYHPKKRFHTTCKISGNGNGEHQSKEVDIEEEQHEAEVIEA